MPGEIFVDAGVWLALANTRDQHHGAAVTIYPSIRQRWGLLVTTNLVVAEAYISIRRRVNHAAAVQFLARIHAAPNLVLVRSTEALEINAEATLRRYADQDFSYADAVSFVVMHERNISHSFTFDNHFATAGFTLVPTPPL